MTRRLPPRRDPRARRRRLLPPDGRGRGGGRRGRFQSIAKAARPCRYEIAYVTCVKRTRFVAQREAKSLLKEDPFRVVKAMSEGVKNPLAVYAARRGLPRERRRGFCVTSADSRESFKILAARSSWVDWRLEAQAALDPFGRGDIETDLEG